MYGMNSTQPAISLKRSQIWRCSLWCITALSSMTSRSMPWRALPSTTPTSENFNRTTTSEWWWDTTTAIITETTTWYRHMKETKPLSSWKEWWPQRTIVDTVMLWFRAVQDAQLWGNLLSQCITTKRGNSKSSCMTLLQQRRLCTKLTEASPAMKVRSTSMSCTTMISISGLACSESEILTLFLFRKYLLILNFSFSEAPTGASLDIGPSIAKEAYYEEEKEALMPVNGWHLEEVYWVSLRWSRQRHECLRWAR